jgi:hypothetical protein
MGDDKLDTLGVYENNFANGSSKGCADCGGVKASEFAAICPRSGYPVKGDDTAEKVAVGVSG